ncbi:MAG: FlgD immunoglobulin-like domain containing protein [Candidatus Kapaibacterium sp.]
MRLNFPGLGSRALVALTLLFVISSAGALFARPVHHSHKGGEAPLTFLRQVNTKSNVEFSYTNRGVLFNAGNGNNEGLFWPRGSGDSYVFGEGLWLAVEKDTAPTALHEPREKLCELGYNPNSGAGWYIEGEASQVGLTTGTDGADPSAKYISYVSPRYDPVTGKYITGSSTVVPSLYYSWPIWDTSRTKTFDRNYYFGDYVSNVNMRDSLALVNAGSKLNSKPAMVSEEDIVNLYSDENASNNPEFKPNTGYPFGIDIQEVIYSWSFGRYRDMIFVRYKVKNSTIYDTLFNCWMAPAFDPDLDASVGGSSNDANSYVSDSLVNAMADSASIAQLREPYRTNPTKLNMAVQWRNYNQPPKGKQYGMLGVSFLESPVIDTSGNIIPNDDSAALHGYGPNSLFQNNQLGLVTVRAWTLANDPTPPPDARYDFVSSGEHDSFNGNYTDQRLLMATGPFMLIPQASAEETLVLTFAHVSDTSYKQNFGALLLLTDFAHQVFGEVDSSNSGGTTNYFVNNFQVTPPSSVSNERAVSGLRIKQPYPDPFRTDCSMMYRNDKAGVVSVIVSDVIGRVVQSFSLGNTPAGEHPLTIGGAKLPAGMYQVTVTQGSASQSATIIHAP